MYILINKLNYLYQMFVFLLYIHKHTLLAIIISFQQASIYPA